MRALMTSIALPAIFAAPAAAQPTGGNYQVAVSYSDLNIYSAAGVAAFNGRVKAGANLVCGSDPVTPLQEGRVVRQCRADFIRGAQRNLQLALNSARGTVLASR
jgi:UrcA family protein